MIDLDKASAVINELINNIGRDEFEKWYTMDKLRCIKSLITHKLRVLSNEFKDTTFSYVYDEKYSQHVVVVEPADIYYSEKFSEIQIKFEIEMINEFKDISLFFTAKVDSFTLPEFEYVIGNK